MRAGLALSLAFLMAALPACGGGDEPLGVTNTAPEGSVGGVVLDLSTGLPLPGAQVTVLAGAAVFPKEGALTTDAAGRFMVEKVPAGALIIDITPPAGYLGARFDATLDDAAGEFPRSNATLSVGPVALVPLVDDAKPFKVRVINADGAPAANVKVQARTSLSWALMAEGTPQARGVHVVEATSDSVGMLAFKGLPDYGKLAALDGIGGISDSVTIVVPAIDQNNDGVYEFLGKQVSYQVNNLGANVVPTIVLDVATGQIEILATTVPGLTGGSGNRVISAGGPFFVAFNVPIDQTLTNVQLFNENGDAVADPVTKNVDGSLLTMNFTNLAAGQEYNLNLRAAAKVGGKTLTRVFSTAFFVKPEPNAKVTAQLTPIGSNTGRVAVTFSEPIGTGQAGANLAVVFFNFDLDASGTTGDQLGEIGFGSTNISLLNKEVDPPGAVGRSGFTRNWELVLPQISGNPVNSGTTVKFVFSINGSPVLRANDEIVPDITSTVP